jgi:hypothetical protein
MKRGRAEGPRDHLFLAWELLDFDEKRLMEEVRRMVLDQHADDLAVLEAAAPITQRAHERVFSRNRRR